MFFKALFLLSVLVIITMASQLTAEEQWTKFKTDNGKTYSGEEETKRFQIFQDNLRQIEEHNKKYDAGEVTYKKGVNKFADLTHEEFQQFVGGVRKPNQ